MGDKNIENIENRIQNGKNPPKTDPIDQFFDDLSPLWVPPERLPLSLWAEQNVTLSSEYSASSTQLKLFGWQKEIFDAFTDPRVTEIVLCCSTQMVKCLDVSTPIPTPDGWKFNGHLRAGDRVFDERGNICNVLGVSQVYRDRVCYRLNFDDGNHLIADADHRWPVFDRLHSGKQFTLTTEEMYDGIGKFCRGNENANRYRIACTEPLNCAEVDLLIDPYILGCWLGDGTALSSDITVDLRDGVLDEMRATGETCRIVSTDKRRPHVAKIAVGGNLRKGCPGRDTLKGRLGQLSLIGDKHIPKVYLRSSESQRRALLQGIMDTDGGTIASSTTGVKIGLTCKSLAYSVLELVRSLGLKPTISTCAAKLYGKDCGVVYVIYFTAYAEDRPFRLPRKLACLRSRLDPKSRVTESSRRSVVSIEKTDSVPVCCIAVDSPSHLYLAGKSMIPTHNTLYLQCILMYVICCDPGPILMIRPDDEDARLFSKERLTPMIRDNPILHGKVSDASQGSKDTIAAKSFPGGILAFVGARSPTGLANRPIRFLLCDEIDKYPASAGKEGDPVSLAWKRTTTFESRRKRVMCCSPTVAGLSRIAQAYRETDMRKLWVACPYCGFEQTLRWEQVKDVSGGSFAHNHGKTARYECAAVSCKAKWTDLERKTAAGKGVWRPDPEILFDGKAGFWISHLYSPWSSNDMPILAAEFLDCANDTNRLKQFKNTSLALEWEEDGETPDFQTLYDRREDYPFGSAETAVIPQRGLFLTAAVDVQESPPRLEYEVVAWGRGRECWSIVYGSIECSVPGLDGTPNPLPVTAHELWDKLDTDVLQPYYRHASGQFLPIWAMSIDTGRRPKPVYEFTRKHVQLRHTPAGYSFHAIRTVIPVKGTSDPLKILSSVSKEDAARTQQGVRIIGVGTHCCKQEIFDALKHNRPSADTNRPNPGCYHHPRYLLPYFQGICSEVRIIKDNGKVEWEQRRDRNEPLDLKVYNRATAAVVGIDRWGEQQWQQLEANVGIAQPVVSTAVQDSGTLVGARVGPSASIQPPMHPAVPQPQPASPYRPSPPLPGRGSGIRPVRGGFGI